VRLPSGKSKKALRPTRLPPGVERISKLFLHASIAKATQISYGRWRRGGLYGERGLRARQRNAKLKRIRSLVERRSQIRTAFGASYLPAYQSSAPPPPPSPAGSRLFSRATRPPGPWHATAMHAERISLLGQLIRTKCRGFFFLFFLLLARISVFSCLTQKRRESRHLR